MTRERRGTHLGVVHVAGGVDGAAQLFGRLGQRERRVALRATQHRPLQEVRHTGRVHGLEGRAAPHEERRGDDPDGRILAHQDNEPIRQHLTDDRRLLGGGRRRQRDEDGQRQQRAPHRAPPGGSRASRVYRAGSR